MLQPETKADDEEGGATSIGKVTAECRKRRDESPMNRR
jgi:hypothetical protein